MTPKRWTTTLAMLLLTVAPLAGQEKPSEAQTSQAATWACPWGRMGSGMMGGPTAIQGHTPMMRGGHMMGGQGTMEWSGMTGWPGMMGGYGMMSTYGMMGTMQGMGSVPSALLAAAEPLGLSADQKTRLESIATTARKNSVSQMQAAWQARQQAAQALNGDAPDLDAYAKALRTASDHMVQAQVAMAKASVDARAVLTEAQRTQLQKGMALVGSMACGMAGYGSSMHAGSDLWQRPWHRPPLNRPRTITPPKARAARGPGFVSCRPRS